MRRTFLATAIVTGVFFAAGHAQEPGAGPSPDVLEMAALSGLVGKFDGRFESKPIAGGPGASVRTGKAGGEWIHGGRFFRQVWTIDALGAEPEMSGSSIMTYDAAKKSYRSWHFASTGSTSEGVGTYDKMTNTMSWTVRDPNGSQTRTKSTCKDGSETWAITVTDADGRVVADMTGKNTPRKK